MAKYEVTNKEFKAFVQAGGYQKREYWDQKFVEGTTEIPWEKAVARFVDATGRPGPSTWELGDYPAGRDAYPVTGVQLVRGRGLCQVDGQEPADRSSLDSRGGHGLRRGDRAAQ